MINRRFEQKQTKSGQEKILVINDLLAQFQLDLHSMAHVSINERKTVYVRRELTSGENASPRARMDDGETDESK